MAQRIEIESGILKEAHIAPFAILRVACLPADTLKAFVKPELSLGLENYVVARDHLREISGELVEQVERLVRDPGAGEFRQILIQLKRDVYNSRFVNLSPDISRWLEEKGCLRFVNNWLELHQQVQQHLECLTREADQSLEVVETVLNQCWENQVFQKGVSLASPSLSSRLTPEWRTFKRKKRAGISRSLFAYVTRAAAKTSPFSTLTSTCILPLPDIEGQSQLSAKTIEISAKSSLNSSVPVALRNALLARHASQLPILFHLNPHITIRGNRVSGVGHRYESQIGLLWLEQIPIALNLAPNLAQVLRAIINPFTWSNLAKALEDSGIPAPDATRSVHELLRRDIIRSQLEWGTDCTLPEAFLKDQLRHCSSDVTKNFVATLSSMANEVKSFSTASASARSESIRQINHLYGELYGKLSESSPPEIRSVIHENAWAHGISFHPGSGFQKMLQNLGKVLNDRICVSKSYIWLRDKFVQQYGDGGVCTDIASFFQVAWAKIRELTPGPGNGTLGQNGSDFDRFAGISIEHVKVPITFLVQIASDNLHDFDNGKAKFVLNMAYNRIGWQTVRWCDSTDKSANSLEKHINRWLQEAWTPKVPVSVTVSSESIALQAHLRCTEQMLVLDGSVSDRDLKLSDLVLRHNQASGLLEVTTQNNVPVQTNYLGAVFPSTSFGPSYLAILLGEPFELTQTHEDFVIDSTDVASVRHRPRVEENNCVLQRANWFVKSSDLFRRLSHIAAVDCLIAANDFCAEFRIPRYVYAKGQVRSWSMDVKAKKPIWLDFQNVLCLESLLALAKEFDQIILAEALPGPGENVLTIDGRKYVSEFIFEAVLSNRRQV